MPSKLQLGDVWLPCLILLVLWARPTAAFGAGNIASLSKIEGQRWRHGDIEDTLLTLLISGRTGKKFSKMDVKRVYFGNWLRDYSQAVDVGTVKMVSAEAIRILLWVLGFLSFGYGTKEFEVTRDRLGCYRPEEHIDNPKDYADNIDARQYDRRLRGIVRSKELGINQNTGLKNYIAPETDEFSTSAGLVRRLLGECIDLGRRSGGRGPEFYEALRLLGTATHCLEDYSAHSNYTELALIELGVDEVFPHVGRATKTRFQNIDHDVYPLVTGTFGGVDFLHSVCGEISDKATQSEMQELEGAIQDANRKQNKSQIKDLLSKLPDGIFGGKDQASKADELEENAQAAQMGNIRINPKEPEEFTQQIGELVKQIYPIMEFHDEIMQSISEFIEKIPVLPELIEQVQEQVTVFVFSLLAPFVLPIIDQVKTELETGSSEVIASAREKQHIVFNDDSCSDPTHSMLSKDHFTNVLNEPAGKIASEVLKWAVPQIVACWDGEADPESTINNIIEGVFHHPAQLHHHNRIVQDGRKAMFGAVQNWWRSFNQHEQTELVQKLSRDGVENGRNHTGDLRDTGHGCCKPLGMTNDFSGITGGGRSGGGNAQFQQVSNEAGKIASEAVGGGALGGLVGGLIGDVGNSLFNNTFGGDEKKSKKEERCGDGGTYTQSYSESGHHKKKSHDDSERYGHAEYSQAQYGGGGRREEFSRYEQDERGGSYGYQQRVETTTHSSTGGYERHEERREGFDRQGENYREEKKKHGKTYRNESDEEQSGDEDDYEKREKKERKKREKEEKKRYKKRGSEDEDSDDDSYKRRSGEHKRKSKSPKRRSGDYSHASGGYGEERRYGEEQRSNEQGYGREDRSRYGEESYSSGGYGGGRQESSGYGGGSYSSTGGGGYSRQESSGYGGDSYSSGGGRQESSGYGGESYYPSGRQESSGYGEGNQSYSSGGGYEGHRDNDEYDQRRQGYGSGGGYDGNEGGYGRRY